MAQFEIERFKKILNLNVLPFMLRLGDAEPYGFIRAWHIVSMSPEKHYAYAFQWFSLATLTLILGLIYAKNK